MQFQALLDHWNVCNRLNHYLEAEQFVDLERLFKLFDSLFFGGRLSHCQLKLYPYLEVGVNSVIVPYSIRSTPGLYSSISISQSGLIARAAKRVESKSDREHRFRGKYLPVRSLLPSKSADSYERVRGRAGPPNAACNVHYLCMLLSKLHT